MKKILVTYATFAGSTVEVAQAIGDEITKSGLQVDVLPIDQVKAIEDYSGVVLGGPMIMGWHRAAMKFLKQHQSVLQRSPLAIFVMAMSLTQTNETCIDGVPVFVDEKLPTPSEKAGHLSFRERHTSLANYVPPILKAARPGKPVSVGVFGGRLEYRRLKWWAMLFVMLIVQAPARDRRNWTAIRSWAAGLAAALQLEELELQLTTGAQN